MQPRVSRLPKTIRSRAQAPRCHPMAMAARGSLQTFRPWRSRPSPASPRRYSSDQAASGSASTWCSQAIAGPSRGRTRGPRKGRTRGPRKGRTRGRPSALWAPSRPAVRRKLACSVPRCLLTRSMRGYGWAPPPPDGQCTEGPETVTTGTSPPMGRCTLSGRRSPR